MNDILGPPDEGGRAVDTAQQFEFDLRVAKADSEGYFYTRWDQSTPMTLTAATRQEAIKQAGQLMGTCDRGWYWLVMIDAVRSAQRTLPTSTPEEGTR